MCIRDRAYIAINKAFQIADIKIPDDLQQVAWQMIRNPNICLLYTSDAADERSSVDLGGSRIIKKKNNNNIASVSSQKHRKTTKTLQPWIHNYSNKKRT